MIEPAAVPAKRSRLPPSLLFSLGGQTHRIELSRLEGVAPWAKLRPAEEAGLLGWLDLRGEPVPVVDLNELLHGKPTEPCLGSRILLLYCQSSAGGRRLVGGLASEVFAITRDDALEDLERFDPCDVLASILIGLR